MNKILSIAVPCYNSQEYMRKCIESLLVGGEEVEIVIVNDGSSDETASIANEYQKQYPTICKAIHQENGGHGEAVNSGLKNSTGAFFKVVDSDDKVSKDAYMKILDVLRETIQEDRKLDMLLSNYVYDKLGASRKKVMKYGNVFPKNTYFTWDDSLYFRKDQYILMHSVIYRTELLRESGLELPKHTFYVDNIFVFQPLPLVKVMYYLDVNFYWYFIGREDQSVNESVMVKRLDQQIRVNKLMIDYFHPAEIENKKCKNYMKHYLEIITTVSSVMAILGGTEESLSKKEDLWKYLEEKNPLMYKKIRYSLLGLWINIPGRRGRKISITGYKIVKKFFGFS